MKTRNKIIIIISSIVLTLALVFLILGFAMSDGWESVAAWFTSKWALWIYVIGGSWLGVVAFVYIGDLIRRI